MKKLILPLLLVCLVSCYNKYKSSVFELRQLTKSIETEKHASASFFLIAGGFSSSETQEIYIQVFAKVDGVYRFIKMNIEETSINIDNALERPTVQILYKKEGKAWSDTKVVNDQRWCQKRYIINCPEIYLPEKLLPISL